jgi:hypothetical protein
MPERRCSRPPVEPAAPGAGQPCGDVPRAAAIALSRGAVPARRTTSGSRPGVRTHPFTVWWAWDVHKEEAVPFEGPKGSIRIKQLVLRSDYLFAARLERRRRLGGTGKENRRRAMALVRPSDDKSRAKEFLFHSDPAVAYVCSGGCSRTAWSPVKRTREGSVDWAALYAAKQRHVESVSPADREALGDPCQFDRFRCLTCATWHDECIYNSAPATVSLPLISYLL